MTRVPGALVAASSALLVFLVGAPARAEDPAAKHELRVPSRWKAGESVTETETSDTSSAISFVDDSGRRRAGPGGRSSQRSTVVRKCLAVDEAGRPTKMLLWVKHWASEGGGEDRSLEGAVLELREDGWTLLNRDVEMTPQARAWLTGDLLTPGSSCEDSTASLLSASPVAVGESWKPTGDGLVGHLFSRLGVPPADVRATCKLVAAEATPGGLAPRVEYDASGESARAAQGEDEPAMRSVVSLRGSVEGTPGAWHRTLRKSESSTLELSMEGEGRTVTVRSESKTTSSHEPGGEIPSWDPPAPDEDATLCPFGATPVRAGDTVTEIGIDEYKVSTRREDCACTPCPTPEDERATEWTLVRRCAEASAEGRPLAEGVHVVSWEHRAGAVPDTCLAGRFLEVTAEGAKLVGPDEGITSAAKEWIAAFPPAGRERPLPLAPRPEGPARVGTKWFPETLDAARSGLWGEGFSLEPDHATGRARIVEAQDSEGTTAKVTFHAETPVRGSAGEGSKRVTALPGSEVRVSGSVNGPVGAWGRLGERSVEVEFRLLAMIEGAPRSLRTVRNVYLDVQPGGEWPDCVK